MEQKLLTTKENFNAVDIAKFILAFFVISIHTCDNFFGNFTADTILGSVLNRIAVPFFFVASGFFFFRKITFENGKIKKCPENRATLFGFLKRAIVLYVLWAIIYFLVEAATYVKAGLSVSSLVPTYANTILQGGFSGPFWYLIFMVYAVIVLYLLLRFVRVEIIGAIVSVLYLIYLYEYSYRPAFGLEFMSGVTSRIIAPTLGALGKIKLYHLYAAMFFMLAGLLCVSLRDKISKWLSGTLALCALALSIAENVLLATYSELKAFSYTFFLTFIAAFGFIFLSKIKLGGNPKLFAFLRNSSSLIYCSHMLHLLVFNNLTNRQYINKPVLYVVIAAASLITALIIVPLSGRVKFLKKLY